MEIIIVIAILGFSLKLIANFKINTFLYKEYAQTKLSAQDETKRILRPMVEEIRSLSPASTGAFGIEKMTGSEFIFYSDANNDGLKERIRYTQSGTSLIKGITAPSGDPLTYNTANEVVTTIINNVVNGSTPMFTYYDSGYTGLAGYASLTSGRYTDVRLVKIYISVDDDVNQAPPAFTLTTQVSLRNLKNNL
ncbi:MAG: hypothetical protein ACR2IQ_02305 [Minisyncoccia bacterium]